MDPFYCDIPVFFRCYAIKFDEDRDVLAREKPRFRPSARERLSSLKWRPSCQSRQYDTSLNERNDAFGSSVRRESLLPARVPTKASRWRQ